MLLITVITTLSAVGTEVLGTVAGAVDTVVRLVGLAVDGVEDTPWG